MLPCAAPTSWGEVKCSFCRSLPGAKVQQPETVQIPPPRPRHPSLQPMLLVQPAAACSTGWASDTRMGGLAEVGCLSAWATAGGATPPSNDARCLQTLAT